MAIFLDCCYAASADRRTVDGTIEVLAACCRETSTIGISDWSFTSRLTEVLHDSRERPLTVAMLHAKLVNYRAAAGSKKLLKTPVHSIMSGKDKASIRLYPTAPGSTNPPPLIEFDLSQQSSLSSSPGLLENDPLPSSTRVLVAVSLKDRVQDAGDWVEWLTTHMPTDVTNLKLIKPEGLWEAHSTLGLISMPVAVWNLFPRTTAYCCIGYIKTHNLLSQKPGVIPIENLIDEELEPEATKHGTSEHVPMDNSPYPVIRHDDVVIVVVGQQGAGKSSFIAKASGKAVKVAEGQDPCTKVVQCYSFLYQGRTVHLIDTPGFQWPLLHEEQVRRETQDWLEKVCGKRARLDGVIGVHPITSINLTVRLASMSWGKALAAPKSRPYRIFSLLTTKWDLVSSDIAEKKEAELRKGAPWIGQARMFRFDGTRELALKVLANYLPKSDKVAPLVKGLQPRKQQDDDLKNTVYQPQKLTNSLASSYL